MESRLPLKWEVSAPGLHEFRHNYLPISAFSSSCPPDTLPTFLTYKSPLSNLDTHKHPCGDDEQESYTELQS